MKDVVLQTDFGTGSLSSNVMHGVCAMVSDELKVHDGNHDVVPFDVLNASDSLMYQIPYWPKGTVFVSVVDPGVGTKRKSCAALLSNGSYVVTPDNGTLTYVKDMIGIEAVREIDESINRLPGSQDIHIFHGRDVYAYCAARLAAGVISFEEVGPEYSTDEIVCADYIHPEVSEGCVTGMINEASHHFGLVGTNIPFNYLEKAGIAYGDTVTVTAEHEGALVMNETMKVERTFGCVEAGEPLLFQSEMRTVMLAINRGNAAKKWNLESGTAWRLTARKENNE